MGRTKRHVCRGLTAIIMAVACVLSAQSYLLEIDFPSKRDTLYGCSNYVIRWHAENISGVIVEYSFNGGLSYEIVYNQGICPGDSLWDNLTWTVPDTNVPQAHIRLTDYGDDELTGLSDTFVVRKTGECPLNSRAAGCSSPHSFLSPCSVRLFTPQGRSVGSVRGYSSTAPGCFILRTESDFARHVVRVAHRHRMKIPVR